VSSPDGIELSVILPCLNEEASVGKVVDEAWTAIERSGLRGEVIVVDNGSTDRSAAIAEEHGARVVQEPMRGYGSAYLRGLDEASGQFLVMADADGTYPVAELQPFLERLRNGDDLVLGSRLKGKIHAGAMPWVHRWIGNPVLTWILNVFFGVKVSDAHCGFRAIRRDALPVLQLQATGMEFASEMILKASKRNLRISDVPIEYFPRTGESKLNTWRDGWRHLRFMLLHSATFLFIVPGLVLSILGFVIMLALATGPVELFGITWYLHAMIAGSLAALVGAQIVQLGLFARTYAVLYLDDRDPKLERVWSRVRLEHGLLLGGLLLLCGAGILLAIFVEWARNGFGALAREHESLLGMTFVGLGVQTIFGSFFLSVLGLRKQFLFDRRGVRYESAEERDTVGAR
jgi:glycosyltransferase involved in cell wall biosynthesis